MSVPLSVYLSVLPFLCPLVCVAFGRRISIEIDFVLCSLKFYVHKVYFDLPGVVLVVVSVVVVLVPGLVLILNLKVSFIVIISFLRFQIFEESKNEYEKILLSK